MNTELVEALALVHDIGHPPFGHAGERKLDELMRRIGGSFNHNLHALRIVEQFEQRYLDFAGLNLTFEVREGIVKHSRDYRAKEFPELAEYLLDLRPPLEAQLIDCVDEIAYNTADLDDAREAELLDLEAVRAECRSFVEAYAQVDARASRGARETEIQRSAEARSGSAGDGLDRDDRAAREGCGVGDRWMMCGERRDDSPDSATRSQSATRS